MRRPREGVPTHAVLEQRLRQQAAVAALGNRALDTADPTNLFPEAVQAVATTLDVELVGVVERVRDDDLLMRAGIGFAETRAGDHVPTSRSPVARVVQRGTPFSFGDLAGDPRFDIGGPLGRHGAVSGVGVPIPGAGAPWGMLGAASKTPRHFTSDDVHFLEAVANVLGAALARRTAADALRQVEEQLRQAQKMEAVGRLAGGIAHDFNNLLTVINGYCRPRAAAARAGRPGAPRHRGDRARRRPRRGAHPAAARLQPPPGAQTAVLDLNAVVADTERMLRRLIGEDVRLASSPAPASLRVEADAGQLEQVIVNLAVNARDAMPAGGTLALATGQREVGAAELRNPDAREGSWAYLSVADTGTGMSDEVRTRLFEPFFTTKELGKGTGLGLSTVYGIIHQSGGWVEVESAEGEGSTFTVYLPLASQPMVPSRQTAPSRADGGDEAVLVVEDEDPVRMLVAQVLEARGYRVVEAATGSEALDLVARGVSIDLLVSDVVMPDLGGPELRRRLLVRHPGLPTLFISGYTEGDPVVTRGGDGPVAFLQKPFTSEALAREVRGLLDGPARAVRTRSPRSLATAGPAPAATV